MFGKRKPETGSFSTTSPTTLRPCLLLRQILANHFEHYPVGNQQRLDPPHHAPPFCDARMWNAVHSCLIGSAMKKVYISATYMDLKDHRSAVAHALRKMNYDVRCMEDYLATDERTDVRCRQDVASCDFYVGIIPQRYGWIPPSADRSITEQEYLEARRHPDKTRCLMFLLGEGAEWPLNWVDAVHNPDAAAKLKAFRSSLDGTSTSSFTTLENLVQEVMAAVYMEDLKTWKMSMKREF